MSTEAEKLSLALIQTDLVWEDTESNLEHLGQLLDDVTDADVAALPEMFSTGFSMASERLAETMDGPTVRWLAERAATTGRVVCGSFIASEADRRFNRFVWMRPDGSFETYDKRHLFRMANEHQHYSEGVSRLVVEHNGWQICPLVWYELRFPVWSRAAGTIDLFLSVANWPARRDSHWRTLLAARAIENQAYVAGLNRIGVDGNGLAYCGGSIALDYGGELMADMESAAAIGNVTFDLTELREWRTSFPAHLDVDTFTLQ